MGPFTKIKKGRKEGKIPKEEKKRPRKKKQNTKT